MEDENFTKKPKLEAPPEVVMQNAAAGAPAPSSPRRDNNHDDEVQVIADHQRGAASASLLLSPGFPAWITIQTPSQDGDDDDMRQHSTVHPYETMEKIAVDKSKSPSPNSRVYGLCYCYVCDVPVKDCFAWPQHCDATDASAYWRQQRQQSNRMENKLIEFELKDAKIFRIIASMMREFLIDCVIHFDQDGMEINALDRSKVVLFDCRMSRAMFSEFEIERAKVQLGLSKEGISNLANGMSRTKKTDTMTLRANHSRLAVDFENEKSPDKAPGSFQLHLEPDLQSERMDVSGYRSAIIKMPSALFRKTVQDLHKVLKDGCTVTIAVTKEEISFRTSDILAEVEGRPGIWSGRIGYRGSHAGVDIYLDGEDELVMLLDMRILLRCAKASMISPDVFISLEPERLVEIAYPLSDGVLTLYVAPKVDDDRGSIPERS
jgi:proliferating cell nuclear antigen PCNA